ncbi:MAG: hypothetical protein D6719_03000, partial [Candidatus Dadabacteria bacterium]
MVLIDFFQLYLNTFFTDTINAGCDLLGRAYITCTCNMPFPGGFGTCPTTAFTKIGAAFATQGYWAQADLLDYLSLTSFGVWAPLIYMLAWIGALVMIAIGQPPRQYLWFVIGPAIYHWLIEDRTPVTGVQWAVGYVDQDQREVWRLAETGLASSNLANRLMYQWPPQGYVKVFSNAAPVLVGKWSGPYAQYKSPHGDDRRPTEIAAVSTAFLWFDELVSSTVQWAVTWTGITRNRDGFVGGLLDFGTNLINFNFFGFSLSLADAKWYLLTDLKWEMVEDITSAKLSSPTIR